MFAAIAKTVATTIAVSAVIDFISRPRTGGSALGTGQSFGEHVRNIPTHVVDGAKATRDFIHGFVDGVRGNTWHREEADAYYTAQAESKRFAEHA